MMWDNGEIGDNISAIRLDRLGDGGVRQVEILIISRDGKETILGANASKEDIRAVTGDGDMGSPRSIYLKEHVAEALKQNINPPANPSHQVY